MGDRTGAKGYHAFREQKPDNGGGVDHFGAM